MKNKIFFTFAFVVVVSFILIFLSHTPIHSIDCYCSDWHVLLGGCDSMCANNDGCQEISVMGGGWCLAERCYFLMEYTCVDGKERTRFYSFPCNEDCNTFW